MRQISAGIKPVLFFMAWMVTLLVQCANASVHDGDILDCDGCHSIKAPDPSSLCLSCHAEKFSVLSENGNLYTPGGDFFWLKRSYRNVNYISTGDMHGHNVIASSYDLSEDHLRLEAPGSGGSLYRSEWLACSSCHDPHQNRSGEESNYRLLGGLGYNGGGKAMGIYFDYPAPRAKGSVSNFGYLMPESDSNHPVYISGMSEWCTNCHQGYISIKNLSHPSGAMAKLNDLANNYRQYNNSNHQGSSRDSSYDFLVPFEYGEGSPGNEADGPTIEANVMCLTCHRAHASPFKSIGRWDLKLTTFLAESPILSTPEGIHAYYGQSITSRYGKNMKSLCTICHPVD